MFPVRSSNLHRANIAPERSLNDVHLLHWREEMTWRAVLADAVITQLGRIFLLSRHCPLMEINNISDTDEEEQPNAPVLRLEPPTKSADVDNAGFMPSRKLSYRVFLVFNSPTEHPARIYRERHESHMGVLHLQHSCSGMCRGSCRGTLPSVREADEAWQHY